MSPSRCSLTSTAATPTSATEPHHWETFVADSLPDGAVYLRQDKWMTESPEVARTAKKVLAGRSRKRSKT